MNWSLFHKPTETRWLEIESIILFLLLFFQE